MSQRASLITAGASSFVVAAAIGLAAVAVVGCGVDRIATVPAQGTVRVDGKSVAGVQVVFHPVSTDDVRLVKLRPTGRTAADGSFTVGTYEMSDGAPVGDYVITAEWFAGGPETSTPASDDPEAVAAGNAIEVDRLGGRFANPQTSPLKASVGRGSSSIPPLDLSTRSAKPAG
jgi:hypothetical protein